MSRWHPEDVIALVFVIGLTIACIFAPGCGDDADPSPRTRCHQKGGVWIYHYKARNVCIKREVVIDYEGDQ